MKTLFVLLSLMAAFPAFASERAYRINSYSMSASYGIAWGVRGELTNFEAIEQAGDAAVSKFLDEKWNKFTNYVVDVESDTILDTLNEEGDDFVSGSFGGMNLGNHYSLSLLRAEGAGIEYEQEFLILNEGYKWSGGFSKIYLVNRSNYKVRVEAICTTCQASIREQMESRMSAEDRALLENLGAEYFTVKESNYDEKLNSYTMPFEFEAYEPKSDEDNSLFFKGAFQIKLENGVINTELLSLEKVPAQP